MAQDNKMDEIRISLDATGAESEITVIRVDGVVDTMTASELEKVMSTLMTQSRYNIIIDLGGVDYISSAGWGIFISNIREIRQHSGDLKLARMVPNVYEIYELLEFDSILSAFENIEKAKVDFNFSLASERSSSDSTGGIESTEILDDNPQTESVSGLENTIQPETLGKTSDDVPGTPANEDQRVLDLAVDDPFLSIMEMKRILNSEAGDFAKIGWWRIRKILKQHRILSKKKRFRFARKH
jgi:anti-sigma B factor antagonist